MSFVYPIKVVSGGGRYLVDQNNVPFFVQGDAPHSLVCNLSLADAATYFANRQLKGFNCLWVEILVSDYVFGRTNASTYDGILPFTVNNGGDYTGYDISTPNSTYFARVDAMVNSAATYGLTCFLDPADTGSWMTPFRNAGTTGCFNWGVYLGNRYKTFLNVAWITGNDFQTWRTVSDSNLVYNIIKGIRSVDPNHIHTVELDYFASSSYDNTAGTNITPLVDINGAYTAYPTYDETLHAYSQAGSSHPTLMIEAHYDNETVGGDFGSPFLLRLQGYWCVLSGSMGQMWGSGFTDAFQTGWQSGINSTATNELLYWWNLFNSFAWWTLVPDTGHTFVSAGLGTYGTTGAPSVNDYCTAAMTADKSVGIAMMPTIRTITVNMASFTLSPVTARWYNPTNGVYTTISGSPFANTGNRTFTPSGTHASDGKADWILVLNTTTNPTAALAVATHSTVSATGSVQKKARAVFG